MAANSPPSFLPQYQDEVTQAQQMQMLAQLLASNKANTEGRMISGHYVRSNPLAHINNLAAGVGGLYGGNKSREMLAKVLQRQGMQQQAERQGVLGMLQPRNVQDPSLPQVDDSGEAAASGLPAMKPGDPMGAERKALGSQFPDIQKLGEELAKQRLEVFKQASAAGDPASIAASGGDPTKVEGVKISPIAVTQTDAGPLYSQSTSRGSLQTGGFPRAPQPPSASVTGQIMQDDLKDLRVQREKRAIPANDALAATQQAYALLKSGVMQTGSEQDKLDYVQKLARFLPGVNVPKNVPANEAFNNFVLPALGETLERMKGGSGSQSEREMIEGLKRGITTTREPEALAAMMEQAMKLSLQTLADYNGRVQKGADLATSNKDLTIDPRLFNNLIVSSGNIPTAENEAGNQALRADPGILNPALRSLVPADKGGTAPPTTRMKFRGGR